MLLLRLLLLLLVHELLVEDPFNIDRLLVRNDFKLSLWSFGLSLLGNFCLTLFGLINWRGFLILRLRAAFLRRSLDRLLLLL